MRLSCHPVLLLPLLILFAGCQTGDIKAVVPISGGKKITVALGRNGPEPGQAAGYRTEIAALLPGEDSRESFYQFALIVPAAAPLRRIQIADVSDDQPVTLVDDAQPQCTNGRWLGKSEAIMADDPRVRWALQLPLSLRAYRFTLTQPSGAEISFYHVTPYPPALKAAIRKRWGENY